MIHVYFILTTIVPSLYLSLYIYIEKKWNRRGYIYRERERKRSFICRLYIVCVSVCVCVCVCVCARARAICQFLSRSLSLSLYIYIYIFWQHFFVDANFIKHNRHFMSTYFLLDPFEFPYYFYRIRGELIYVLSIVVCIPSTFCPTLGHHQGRIYYKSDVTFVLAYYYCERASLPLKIIAFAFKWNYIISVGS